jgi:membrane fusion protein, multidrug efflux system
LLDDQEKIVLQDQGTVKNDQGTVNYDQVQLSYCHITAPISGRLVFAWWTPATWCRRRRPPAGGHYADAADHGDLHHGRRQPGQVQARMRKMHTLPVEAWDRARPDKLPPGKLLTIDNQIDTTTGTVKAARPFR